MSIPFGEAFYITFCGLGIEIDNVKESPEEFTMYISVPKDSTDKSPDGEVLVGAQLAKRIKEKLSGLGVKRLSVKYKIRDEVWSKEKRIAAEAAAKRELYGRQA